MLSGTKRVIVGIDEVGRGSWAGPLVMGAVVMGSENIPGLTDSKKLTAKRRNELSHLIKHSAQGIGLGWVSAKVIDEIGLSRSLTLATQRALAAVHCQYDQIIIDGTVKFVDDPRVVTMKQADLLVPSVSAASIVAKVARDNYMKRIAHLFPGYNFDQHVGYGTLGHRTALRDLGPSAIHRMSYAPLKQAKLAAMHVQLPTSGQRAETAAAEHLRSLGFRVIERNWKTKWCEVDIIAQRDNRVYFVEVKYRKTDYQGTGLSYITPAKQKQMKFAAELWLSRNTQFEASVLSAMSLQGEPMVVTEFIEQI